MKETNYWFDWGEIPNFDWFTKLNLKKREVSEEPGVETDECYCVAFILKKDTFPFVKNGVIFRRGETKLAILEDSNKLYKFLAKKKIKIIWHGKTEKNFLGRKFLDYEEGMENWEEFFYYKSVIVKVFQ